MVIPANAEAVTCDGPAGVDDAGSPRSLSGLRRRCRPRRSPPPSASTRSDLDRLGAPVETPSGRVVRLQQSVDGVPVFNGQVALTYDRAGHLDMVQSSAIPEPEPLDEPRYLRPSTAVRSGRLWTEARPSSSSTRAAGTPILAWHVERATPTSDLNAIVDAQTGALVRSWDAIQDATAAASAYDPNPVQMSGNTALTDATAAATLNRRCRRRSTLTNLAIRLLRDR